MYVPECTYMGRCPDLDLAFSAVARVELNTNCSPRYLEINCKIALNGGTPKVGLRKFYPRKTWPLSVSWLTDLASHKLMKLHSYNVNVCSFNLDIVCKNLAARRNFLILPITVIIYQCWVFVLVLPAAI